MNPDPVLLEVGGREYRLRFSLTALARLQKAAGTKTPGETIAFLMSCDENMEAARLALWASAEPTDGEPRPVDPDEMSETIELRDYGKIVQALWVAISHQFPPKEAPAVEAGPDAEVAAGDPPLELPAEPRKRRRAIKTRP